MHSFLISKNQNYFSESEPQEQKIPDPGQRTPHKNDYKDPFRNLPFFIYTISEF